MQIPEWVALRAFDEDKPVYLPSGQISDYLPVLDRQVKHDPPREENGVRFWRVSCTRDTLIGVVQSINSNTICVHGTAHQEDVLREMTRLGAVVRHKYHDDDKTGNAQSDTETILTIHGHQSRSTHIRTHYEDLHGKLV